MYIVMMSAISMGFKIYVTAISNPLPEHPATIGRHELFVPSTYPQPD